jgi:hypothetical protein
LGVPKGVITPIDRRILVANGTCGYCGKHPIVVGRSKSRCERCLNYHRAYQKGASKERTFYDFNNETHHAVYATSSGKESDSENITYWMACQTAMGVKLFWEIEERFKVERADGGEAWCVVKWRELK